MKYSYNRSFVVNRIISNLRWSEIFADIFLLVFHGTIIYHIILSHFRHLVIGALTVFLVTEISNNSSSAATVTTIVTRSATIRTTCIVTIA